MSSRNDVIYERQCEQWHNDLLKEFESNNTNNLMARLDEIENVVNRECNQYSFTKNGFKIGLKQRQKLITLCNKDLREHTVVSHGKCASKITSAKEYKSKARNKLNRWKPKVFGDHILSEIIFINTYNYCYEIGRCKYDWDDYHIKNLFLTIFCKLLSAKIGFLKTRDVALILPTVFTNNTLFRRSCLSLLQHFDESESWNIKSGKKAADKAHSLQKCLQKILHTPQTALPPPIILHHMNITEVDTKCNVYYMHIITELIVAIEEEEYMHYDQRLSTAADYIFINIINEYVCGTMSFWTVTPRQPIQPQPVPFGNFIDGDIIIDTSPDLVGIPLSFGHNNNVYPPYNTENSQYLCPLMNNNSLTSLSANSFTSSLSSINDEQLHSLPQLDDEPVTNLVAVVSGEEMECNQMEVEHAQIGIPQPMCGNSQPITRNTSMSMVNNTPHITQQLPPPLHTMDNYTHYQPRNPHISQQLPRPHPHNNTFATYNVPVPLQQHYNHSQLQSVPPVHGNNFNANNSQSPFTFVGNNYVHSGNTPRSVTFSPRNGINNNNNLVGHGFVSGSSDRTQLQYDNRGYYEAHAQFDCDACNQTIYDNAVLVGYNNEMQMDSVPMVCNINPHEMNYDNPDTQTMHAMAMDYGYNYALNDNMEL